MSVRKKQGGNLSLCLSGPGRKIDICPRPLLSLLSSSIRLIGSSRGKHAKENAVRLAPTAFHPSRQLGYALTSAPTPTFSNHECADFST